VTRFYPLLFVLLWSTGFIGARYGLPYAEPLSFLSLRYGLVIVLMGAVALATRAPWPQAPRQWLHIGVTGLLVHGVYLGGVFVAISHGLPAGIAALTFIQTMFRNRWTTLAIEADDPLPTGLVVGAAHGAWDISYYAQNHPETLKQIVIGPMLRDAAGFQPDAKTHTFADAKGMVLFKSSQRKAEALAFMAWVFSDEELSLLWFKETGMPPARGDLMSNPRFADFFRDNPLAAQYAAYVDAARPSAHLEETIDINKIMVQMVDRVLFDARPVQSAAAEATRDTDQLLRRSQ
jgi:ABC-type glycerol-3-phosphate transport system substrate-binding protein